MAQPRRSLILSVLIVIFLSTLGLARSSQAGLTDAAAALAGPLAEQFGVPASSVTGLLENGLSLDSVTQLLFVSKSSETDLDDVGALYEKTGSDIDATATKLKVAAEEYSPDRVAAAIDDAKAKVQADTTEKAAKGANDAIGSALGGLRR